MRMREMLATGLLLIPGIAHGDYPTFAHLSSGIIYPGPITQFNPGSVKAANGDILVQFNSGSDGWPGEKAYLIRSIDQGITWGNPTMIIESTMTYAQGVGLNTSVGITLLKNGDLILPFNEDQLNAGWSEGPPPIHSGFKWAHTYVIISHDDGNTWGPWIDVHGFPNSIEFGQIVERSNGDLLLPLWTRDSIGTDTPQPDKHSGYVISHDHGQTWGELTDFDSKAGETSLLELLDGSFLGLGKPGIFKRNTGQGWGQIDTGPFHAGKSASLYLSPHGFPFVTYSNVPSHLAFSTDNGTRWYDGYVFEPYIPSFNPAHHTYALSAINLDANRLMVIYFASDPGRPVGSQFLAQNTYLAYEILEETVQVGDPPGPALSDPLPVPPVTINPSVTVSQVKAYPCPWRSSHDMGRDITFAGAPNGAEIKIFTIAAQYVRSIFSSGDKATWDLTNSSGERVASGVYVYLVSSAGFKQTGKLAVIR